MSDAGWDDPASAVKFNKTFPRGSREQALTDWLAVNHFKVDRSARKAARSISSLPCNEAVQVDWSVTPEGKMASAHATVSEAGCL